VPSVLERKGSVVVRDALVRRDDVIELVKRHMQGYERSLQQYTRAWDLEGAARIDHKVLALEVLLPGVAALPEVMGGEEDR
jgi:uncharacterized protein YijF (DUF1287 family)